MKIRTLLALLLLSMTFYSVIGCGNGTTTVTPVKDTTPKPPEQPVAGDDST